ncbi:hypothetical protein GCM10028812_25650 [Ancylobacter sonchi]
MPRKILYDRMTAVVTGEGRAEGIVYNRSLIDLARHFGFHPTACRPYRAKTKGKVDRPYLRALPMAPFCAVLRLARPISRESMVSVDGKASSVPDAIRRRVVKIHSLANEIQIFEGGHLIAVHPVLEGRSRRRIEACHRRHAEHARSRPTAPGTILLHSRGDKVAQRSLAFYDAVGRTLA